MNDRCEGGTALHEENLLNTHHDSRLSELLPPLLIKRSSKRTQKCPPFSRITVKSCYPRCLRYEEMQQLFAGERKFRA
jgi:hypothetical protein